MTLTNDRIDRALGAIIGSAVGDALGAPYEFDPPMTNPPAVFSMTGGKGWEVGEWTDDTDMMIPIIEALSNGRYLENESTINWILCEWISWISRAKDVGIQTRSVLSKLSLDPTEKEARLISEELHNTYGRSGGNGSLMRAAPLVLPYLYPDAETSLVRITERYSRLTHYDQDASDACILWLLTLRHTILNGTLISPINFISYVDKSRQSFWVKKIEEAEKTEPSSFSKNGWVVEAFQSAWCSVFISKGNYVDTVQEAIKGGYDTDTIAAIAGSLAGAHDGWKNIPLQWQQPLHNANNYTVDFFHSTIPAFIIKNYPIRWHEESFKVL
jgi:ADP-ribosylglycohydrolase